MRVIISNGPIEVTTTALLDGGSEATLITAALASVLSLKGKCTNIRLRTFHGVDPASYVRKTTFTISSFDRDTSFAIKCAYIVEDINMAYRIIDWQVEKGRWNHLAELPLHNFNSNDVGLLIGVNVTAAMMQLASKRAEEENAPLAILTPFGWTVMGPVPSSTVPADTVDHQPGGVTPTTVDWLTNVLQRPLNEKNSTVTKRSQPGTSYVHQFALSTATTSSPCYGKVKIQIFPTTAAAHSKVSLSTKQDV